MLLSLNSLLCYYIYVCFVVFYATHLFALVIIDIQVTVTSDGPISFVKSIVNDEPKPNTEVRQYYTRDAMLQARY